MLVWEKALQLIFPMMVQEAAAKKFTKERFNRFAVCLFYLRELCHAESLISLALNDAKGSI